MTAPRPPALRLRGLKKAYRNTAVLKGMDLVAQPGEVVAFIGPNGSGKSTAMRIIAGLTAPDEGTVEIAGFDTHRQPLEAKRELGYAPQEMALSPFLTGREFLQFVADVKGLENAQVESQSAALFDRFELNAAADRLTREYSEGMARKLTLSAAVLGPPSIVLLDETLNGLDPQSSHQARELVCELADSGTAVVLTTHILGLVEDIADRVALLHDGQVALELDRAALTELSRERKSLEMVYLEAIGARVDPIVRTTR